MCVSGPSSSRLVGKGKSNPNDPAIGDFFLAWNRWTDWAVNSNRRSISTLEETVANESWWRWWTYSPSSSNATNIHRVTLSRVFSTQDSCRNWACGSIPSNGRWLNFGWNVTAHCRGCFLQSHTHIQLAFPDVRFGVIEGTGFVPRIFGTTGVSLAVP
jgi:hypothetical protein